MFDGFNFSHLQMRCIKTAMDALLTYRPDGRTPVQVQTDITDGIAARDDFQAKLSARNLANGELEEAVNAGHTLCVQVYPIMQSRFRKDHGSSKAIERLPVDDRTQAETRDRMKAISALWASLPNPPDSATPFKAWDTLGRPEFDAALTLILTNETLHLATEQPYELALGKLHKTKANWDDFISAALAQGRGQFLSDTPEREVIDAIPTAPAQQPPAKAVITSATSPAAGTATLTYNADRATTFDLYRKGPADPDFLKVGDDLIVKTLTLTGLAAGLHEFKVLPRNSRGTGPESDVSGVNVT
jgi:hypothetical protein